jgi:hypothetical protein
MSRLSVRIVLPLLLTLVGTTTAWADDQEPPPQPPPPPPPGGYIAPLSQTYQSTYVPQSVALSGPEEINSRYAGQPAPDGYTPVLRTRKGLVIGGGITLGVAYGYSALIAAVGSDLSDGPNEAGAMWIPVAGPFIQMSQTESATFRVLLAGFGIAQVTGAVLLYKGLTSKKTVFVRNDLVSRFDIAPMAPTASNNYATGMLLGGSF